MTTDSAPPRTIHVSLQGDDASTGDQDAPLRTIHAAAQIAQPGDTVRVSAGTYRESIHPARGGTSEDQRITYEAAPGEIVEILGSEIVSSWEPEALGLSGTWKTTVSNDFFGGQNPFDTLIEGDWFLNMGRPHHTGSVYLSGLEFHEAATWEHLQNTYWYAEVDKENTTIWINCGSRDPNTEVAEVNVRPTVFYPNQTGIDYITVRGFHMRHAATNWAPPTAEQIGLIGTNWSKGWIIEDNVISHSRCVAVTLGKYGDEFDNKSANSAEGYVDTIKRALDNGWSREQIGGHVVRNNTIAYCEQAGIVGSLGAIFSEVSGNVIHDIHRRRHFGGAEQGAIKFHAPIDTLISGNHIYNCNRAIWMDWMAQGTRITKNLCHDNIDQDLFMEVNHGPFVVDHNLFLSDMSAWSVSQGGAYVHNLFAGRVTCEAELRRDTPYHPQSSVEIAGIEPIKGGDDRYFNNLFCNASALEGISEPVHQVIWAGGRHVRDNACSFPNVLSENHLMPFGWKLYHDADGWHLRLSCSGDGFVESALVTTASLGESAVAKLPYLNYNGEELVFDSDYFDGARTSDLVIPGPFADLSEAGVDLDVFAPTFKIEFKPGGSGFIGSEG